ncbi:MAG: HD domain-containing protein [Promethearchaeota archaeon]
MSEKSEILKNNITHLNATYSNINVYFELINLTVIAKGNTYDHKDKLKDLGFYWNAKNKVWEISARKLTERDFSKTYVGPYQPMEDSKKKILEYIAQVSDKYLHDLLEIVFVKGEYRISFFNSPGAKKYHHAYTGGLAEHTLQVLEGALKMIQIYPYIDISKDMIITSALLHDIGKVKCYANTSEGIQITKYLEDFDHIILGITIISRISEELIHSNDDKKKFEHLIQIVTSHHNLPEWGSPKEPKSPEAWIIHTMDQLSSKIGGSIKNKLN